ncbi:MAG: hypothetical protein HZB16_21750 [Armatimonadetes bacterium]|nr:hypothetical protein [Armatimonadota bacterium]
MQAEHDHAWLPPAEQIASWLGDFGSVALRRELTPRERESLPLPEFELARRTASMGSYLAAGFVLVTGLLLLLALAASGLGRAQLVWCVVMLVLAAATLLPPRVHSVILARGGQVLPRARHTVQAQWGDMPVVVETTVSADARGIRLATEGSEQTLAWEELVEVQHHGEDALLCSEYGEALRLPRTSALRPVLHAAGHVVAARAAHDQAAAARLERGLSRPEHDEHADRGLSVTGGG